MMNWSAKAIEAKAIGKVSVAGVILSALIVCLASVAQAAGNGEGHGSPWADLAYQSINLAILAGILIYFARKPVSRFLRISAAGAKQTLDDARKEAGEAETRLEEQRKNIASLKAELESMKADARAEAEVERDRLKSDADALAERLRQQSRLQIEQARNQAIATMRVELTAEASRVAWEMIVDRMSAGHQRHLLDAHLERLEAPP